MSLFQCYECGSRENTALCNFWVRMAMADAGGKWCGLPSQSWMLCSACDPKIHEWHGEFERLYLPKGQFHTNARGNLEHTETGSELVRDYATSGPSV